MDIFAWQPSNMSGVPRELAEYYLNINPGAKPVKQAMRCFGDKKRRAIGMELVGVLGTGVPRSTCWKAQLRPTYIDTSRSSSTLHEHKTLAEGHPARRYKTP